jgi:hypothetical protein
MYIQMSDLRDRSASHWLSAVAEDPTPKIASNNASDGLGELTTDIGVGGTVIGLAALASSGIGFYHGYKRNGDSFGWGLWWAFMGSIFPVITPAYAFAQGLGKPVE